MCKFDAMADAELTALLSEMKRLHRRLDVMSQEHQMMLSRMKRIELLLTEIVERPERKAAIRELAWAMMSDRIDVPPDLRKLLPDADK
jgi:hypothetical protein